MSKKPQKKIAVTTTKKTYTITEQKFIDSAFEEGLKYEKGIVLLKNIKKAVEFYEKAAQYEHDESLFRLGVIYEEGDGIEEDIDKAQQYYERAVKMVNLGLLHQDFEDYKKAKALFVKAGQLGNTEAKVQLGNLLQNGLGGPADLEKAKKMYESAMKDGHLGAIVNLGFLYDEGLGVEQDIKKAIKYYEQAGELGSAQALYNLGGIYEDGEEGIEQNFETAKKYYQEAINLGDSDALISLGLMYKNGCFDKNNQPDYKTAIDYFKLAMEKENVDGYLNLANFYENEYGVEKNDEKLKELYFEAAELDSDEAMTKLGIIFEQEENFEKAREYYERAAAFENPDSLYRLGVIYKEGKGVDQDIEKSIAYLREAKEIYENEDSEDGMNMLILVSEELQMLKSHSKEEEEEISIE